MVQQQTDDVTGIETGEDFDLFSAWKHWPRPLSDVTSGSDHTPYQWCHSRWKPPGTSLMAALSPKCPQWNKVSGYYGDTDHCLLIGCCVRRGQNQSVAQQQVRGRSSRSHSRGQRSEGVLEWKASLFPERNAIGQSLKRHRQNHALWLADGKQHDTIKIWQSVSVNSSSSIHAQSESVMNDALNKLWNINIYTIITCLHSLEGKWTKSY